MKIIKGDKVRIIKGRDRGREGLVTRVYPRKGKVLVEGINVYKKHLKSRGKQQPGGIIDITRPVPISNVALVCPKTNKPTRIAFRLMGKDKVRVSVVSGEVISAVSEVQSA